MARVTISKRLKGSNGRQYYVLGFELNGYEILIPRNSPTTVLLYFPKERAWVHCFVKDRYLQDFSGEKLDITNPNHPIEEVNKLIMSLVSSAYYRTKLRGY